MTRILCTCIVDIKECKRLCRLCKKLGVKCLRINLNTHNQRVIVDKVLQFC